MRRVRRRRLALLAPIAAALVVGLFVPWRTSVLPRVRYYATLHVGAPPSTEALPTLTPRPEVHLAVAGDVGTGTAAERRTATAMARLTPGDPYDALLLLGDNVYPAGDPHRVRSTVFQPFRPVLSQGTRLLPVLGNHDVEHGHGNAEAAALRMPGRWYATTIGDVLIVALDSTRADDGAQRAFLEHALRSSSARWKLVELHFPLYSAGFHGSNMASRRAFEPLFRRFGVQLVLSGHDHDYQRSRPQGGVTYIVSGGAATLRRTGRASFTAVSWSTHHFLDIGVWHDRLSVRAVDQDGRMIDHVTLRP